MTSPVSDAIWLIVGLEALIFVGVIVLVVAIAYFRRQARQRAWSELADRTGLTFESDGWFGTSRVTGVYRGHQLTLDTFRRGSSGKNSTTYTRIVLFVNNQSNLYLALYHEGVFSKIGKFFGMQDIQVGDIELDRRFIIKGKPEKAVVSVLTSGALPQKLLEARSVNLEVDGRELHFEQVGVELKVDYLEFLFDLLSDLAEAVERLSQDKMASCALDESYKAG